MQPYVFPYLGYMHLVNASDIFVFYDDVTFIKQGWINRNRIIVNNSPYNFTIPLQDASSFRWIKHTLVKDLDYFKKKFIKQVTQSYRKARNYKLGIEYIEAVLDDESANISDIAQKSVIFFFDMMGIEKLFLKSSELPIPNRDGISAADRLIDITKYLDGDRYINLSGGVELYSKDYFASNKVQLNFVSSTFNAYDQGGGVAFIPSMSIIDLVMRLEPDEIREHLSTFELI